MGKGPGGSRGWGLQQVRGGLTEWARECLPQSQWGVEGGHCTQACTWRTPSHPDIPSRYPCKVAV